ncbi:MAG: hypothetical protein HWD59_11870 [Coxiellaceae bacterium]|nr:MAG: hypothetical protein HWD59_11870 [Coxiellaceae bacterium]
MTIAQVAIALQQANPGAFTANNINGLKIGQKLRVPTLAAMHRMTPTEAQTMIDKQNLAWKNSSTKNSRTCQISDSY